MAVSAVHAPPFKTLEAALSPVDTPAYLGCFNSPMHASVQPVSLRLMCCCLPAERECLWLGGQLST